MRATIHAQVDSAVAAVFHAQQAGAVGCIFVDGECDAVFHTVPRVESAPIYPGGPVLTAEIPCFLTLSRHLGVLQEGALHSMFPVPTPVGMDLPSGWVIGNIVCIDQESGHTMTKAQESQLMQVSCL
jgi:hypothetical protein